MLRALPIDEYADWLARDVPWVGDTQVSTEFTPQVKRLVETIGAEQLSAVDLRERLGLSDAKSFRQRYLRPALDACLVEMTILDKPQSRNQQYRLTAQGRNLLSVYGS